MTDVVVDLPSEKYIKDDFSSIWVRICADITPLDLLNCQHITRTRVLRFLRGQFFIFKNEHRRFSLTWGCGKRDISASVVISTIDSKTGETKEMWKQMDASEQETQRMAIPLDILNKENRTENGIVMMAFMRPGYPVEESFLDVKFHYTLLDPNIGPSPPPVIRVGIETYHEVTHLKNLIEHERQMNVILKQDIENAEREKAEADARINRSAIYY